MELVELLVLRSCYRWILLQELLLLMDTWGTVPHPLISDQTYLSNTYLVFILVFESSFLKSTLAAFPSTSNFSPIAVHRLFSTSSCLQLMSALLYRQGYFFLPPQQYFLIFSLKPFTIFTFTYFVVNSHKLLLFSSFCLFSFIVPFIEIAREK